ncbi:MFS transporter [Streptomyces sp. NPDC057702]|uniref:MFS transporter n=1 Tax=unclassified Streptomyces TaxID=2593676 RepID=UPI0036AE58D3
MGPETGRHHGAAHTTLAVSCAATLLVLINFTAPMSTVRALSASLGAGPTGQTWMLGGISVGLAACLMAAGALADGHGRKRVFACGGVALAAASALCAAAPTTGVFVAGRLAQGAASAALLASSLGLLGHAYAPGPARARATGLWGAMVGGGIAVGPVFTALLGEVAPWRTAYVVIAGAAALVTGWGLAALRESRATERRRFDTAGVLTLGAGIALLVAALTEGRAGWGQPRVVALLCGALALLVAFAWAERRAPEPVLDPTLLRRPAFRAATVGALVTGVGVIGLMTYVPVLAQRVLGLSPPHSALLLAIWSGLSFLAAPQARRLAGRVGGRQQVVAGLVLCGVGEWALVGVGEQSSWWRLVPGLALAGLGSGVVNAALAGLAVHSVPAHRVAVGSAANNTARYLGSSIGVALVAAVLALPSHGGSDTGDVGTGMSRAAAVAGTLTLAGAALVALCRDRAPIPTRHAPPTAPVARGGTPGAGCDRREAVREGGGPARGGARPNGEVGPEGVAGHGPGCAGASEPHSE